MSTPATDASAPEEHRIDPAVGDRPAWARWAIDVGVALVVLWFTLAQWGSRGFGQYEDVAAEPNGLGFALVLLASLPLIWRRVAPWRVLGVVIAASLALAALDFGVHIHIGVAVAIYTLGARPGRDEVRPLLGIAPLALGALVALEAVNLGFELGDYIVDGLLWTGAWLIGDRRRVARQRAAEARERVGREHRLALAEERTRIARELHDSAGHAINTILVQAGAARVLRDRDPDRSREAIEAVEEVARETLGDIDRIVGALREGESAELAPLPGIDGIGALVERHRAGGFDFGFELRGDPGRAVPQPVQGTAYRIAQEALTNAARHGAGSAEIVVERGPERLEVVVTSPLAPGAPAEPTVGGRGILGMRERAALLGGSVEAGHEGDRFRVRAVLPYDRERP